MRFLQAENLVTFVLISQNTLDTKLLPTLVAKGLDRLHVSDVANAEMSDQPELIYQRFVRV
jgi:hypothetical protein